MQASAATVTQGSTYTLHLSAPVAIASTIQSWTINWGDGTTQTVTGDPSSVTHVYANGNQTFTISATAVGGKTVVSSLTNRSR